MRKYAAVGAVLLVAQFLAVPAAFAANGTGVLYMYSDSGCTTLLPQVSGGNMGYILPATGTTVYIEVKGITETGVTRVELNYNGSPSVEILPVTVTAGNTNCVPWVVGTFGATTGFTIGSCTTGIVFYGNVDKPNQYKTNSNGGSDGGHFYGPGTDAGNTCAQTSVPEFGFGTAGLLLTTALLLPALVLLRRRFARF